MRSYDFVDKSLRTLLLTSLLLVPGCPRSKPVNTTNYSSSPRPTEQNVSSTKRTNSYPEPAENLLQIRGPANVLAGRSYTFVVDGSTNMTLIFGGSDSAIDIDVPKIKSFRLYGDDAHGTEDSSVGGFSFSMPEVDKQGRELDAQLKPIIEAFTSEDVGTILNKMGPDWAKSDQTEKVILSTPATPSTAAMVKLANHCRYEIPITFHRSTEVQALEFNSRAYADGSRRLRESQFTVSVTDDSSQACPSAVQMAKQPRAVEKRTEHPYFLVSIGDMSGQFDVEDPGPRREIEVGKVNAQRIIYDNLTREKAFLGGIMRHLGHGYLYFFQFSTSYNQSYEVRYRIDRRNISGVEVFDCFQEFVVKPEYRRPGQNEVYQTNRTVFSVSPSWKPGEEAFFMVFGPERMGSRSDGSGEWFTMDQKPSEFLSDFAAFVSHCDGVRRRGFDRTPFDFTTQKGLHPAVERILVNGEYKIDWRYILSPEFFSGERASPLWQQE